MTSEIKTPEEIKPASKKQLDALIDICLECGYVEAAGLLKLGSDSITASINAEKEVNHYSGEFSDSDTQERNDIYTIGMGA